eukprot:TRINITY_DN2044_c0_g1_i1.p1 TRINITY_DN2044_c0_g1~~TRINITY_DN2044_c0_g1_i1.p1  ORF type:complete len:891 (+),score=176.17 TRINITY_DN2044_c0_g1_i1:67-2673(+)
MPAPAAPVLLGGYTPQGSAFSHVLPSDLPKRPSTPVPDIRKLYGLTAGQQLMTPQGLSFGQQLMTPQALQPPKLLLQLAPGQEPVNLAAAPWLWQRSGGAQGSGGPKVPKPRLSKGLERSQLVRGQAVDYWSDSHGCWIPATIVNLDSETGGVYLDVKPSIPIVLADQRRKLRSRTVPNLEQASVVQAMLVGNTAESIAETLFFKATGTECSMNLSQVPELGAQLDSFLGMAGCQTQLMQMARRTGSLSLEQFKRAFWELAQMQQEISVQAIPRHGEVWTDGTPWQKYSQGEVLGQGTYGTVHLAHDHQSEQVRAVKTISITKMKGNVQSMKKEIQNLTQLDHPHILKLYEVFSTAEAIHLVTDFCSGGELQACITRVREGNRELIPEAWTADAGAQLMKAISHIHVRGIIHLDLKSANIMLMPSLKTKQYFQSTFRSDQGHQVFNDKPHLMVIDLGVAMYFKPGDYRGNRPTGTPLTMAPEVWRGEVTPAADVWSCGCVLFELLSLRMPFDVKFDGDCQEVVDFWSARPRPCWQRVAHCSPDAIALLRKMLVFDRPNRISASACLAERFLQGVSTKQLKPEYRKLLVQRLATVHRRSTLYKSIAVSIAKDWPPNKMPSFRQLFSEFDVYGNGSLPLNTLAEILSNHGVEMAEAHLAAGAMNLSQDKASVHWTEFVAACIDLSQPEFREKVYAIFKGVDEDGDNLLAPADLAKLFPQGSRYANEAAKTIFTQIIGRDVSKESGARMDWNTFYSHLINCAHDGMQVDTEESRQSKLKELKEQWGIFADIVNAVSNVAAPLFSTRQASSGVSFPRNTELPGERLPQTEDEILKSLEDMGFQDRALNQHALRKNRGKLDNRVLDAIMRGGR